MHHFRILHLGCKVNRYDGETIRAELRRFGLSEAAGGRPADLVVLNTCAVTDRAVQKGRQALRRLRRENPDARLLVTGCMTAPDRAGFQRIEPGLVTVPPRERSRLREALVELLGDAVPALPAASAELDAAAFESRTRAFLKVQDGCDSRCSFCVIPSIRGSVRSRARAAVVAEARGLIERGFRELVLCGIHLGHYGRDTGDDVLSLATAVATLPGEFRLRLSSLEITEVDESVATTLADCERIAPHLHVPLQSGDNGVLRAMRRPYPVEGYQARIATVRAAVPDLALTTDVIVGFPGETDRAFENTVAAVRAARFSKVHVFPFSPRVGTPAADLPGKVPLATIRARVARLLEEERRLRDLDAAARVGSLATVLVERSDARESSGLCERYRRIRLPGRVPTSTFTQCHIVGRAGDDLLGEPCP